MSEAQKSLRMTIGQVMIVVANLLVVLTWGLRIEGDIGRLMEKAEKTEVQVDAIRVKLEATSLAEAVLSARLEALMKTAPPGEAH